MVTLPTHAVHKEEKKKIEIVRSIPDESNDREARQADSNGTNNDSTTRAFRSARLGGHTVVRC